MFKLTLKQKHKICDYLLKTMGDGRKPCTGLCGLLLNSYFPHNSLSPEHKSITNWLLKEFNQLYPDKKVDKREFWWKIDMLNGTPEKWYAPRIEFVKTVKDNLPKLNIIYRMFNIIQKTLNRKNV